MFNIYSFGFLLQIFCVYHAYTSKVEYYWYFVIFFIPILGSLAYLYVHLYSRRKVDVLTEGIKTVFVSNYSIDKLEQSLKFSDTIVNRIQLADEHLKYDNNERALELYQSSLQGIYEDDPSLLQKILVCHYNLGEHNEAIKYGPRLKGDSLFKNSEERIAYAWSLHIIGHLDEAEQEFKDMDIRFSNYIHRLEYAKFKKETGRNSESQKIVNNLLSEIASMDAYETRLKKDVIKLIKQFNNSL